jgi:hypothetical protein
MADEVLDQIPLIVALARSTPDEVAVSVAPSS